MIIWVRNIIFIVFILSVIYVLLASSGRMRHRKRLTSEYKAAGTANKDQGDFIAKGMIKYERSMRPKLLLFVYIIPILIIGTLIYLAQYT